MFIMRLLVVLCYSFWTVVLLNSQPVVSTKEQFKLLGLFTIDSIEPIDNKEAYGVYPREAARLAVEHVREEELLAEHNYELQMLEFETPCDQIGVIEAALEFNRNQDLDTPNAFIGPVCSESAELLASITSQYLKTVQVSYGVLSPEFSDVEMFSYFYRTVPDFTAYIKPIAALLEYYDWQVFGFVLAEDVRYGLFKELLVNYFSTQKTYFEITSSLSIASHFRLEGRGLRDLVRIYLALVDETMGADTLCAAYRSGLTGGDFVWILLGDYYDGWWMNLKELECTEEEMLAAVQSVVILSNTRQVRNKFFRSITGQNESAFWDDFSKHLKLNTGLDFDESRTPRVLQTYDAVWAIAKALNITLTEGNFTSTVEDRTTVGVLNSARVGRLHEALNKNMKKLSFIGASGKIKFSEEFNSPQDPATIIFQMQNRSILPMGIYKDSSLDFESNLSWTNGVPPRDRPLEEPQLVDLWIIIITFVLTTVVFVYIVAILIVNIIYRKHKVIKASSPYINIVMLVGCFFALAAIPLASVEHLDVDKIITNSGYLFFCNGRAWLVHLAITLAFGALFAKTWRVYLIFRNPWTKARPYKDRVLLCIVGVMVAIDVVLLSLSTWRAPFALITFNVTSQTKFVIKSYRLCLTEGSTLYDPDTEFLVWLVLHTGLKALLLIFGVFLVVQTSKIKTKFFQDSRYIGICIFAFVIIVGIGVPTSFGLLFNLQQNLSYVFLMLTVLIIVTFNVTTIFIPRFLLLRKYKHKVPTALLVGLNPSFQVLKKKLRISKVSKKLPKSKNGTSEITASTTMLVTPSLPSPSDSSNSTSSHDSITESWESAYEKETVSSAKSL